MDLYKTYDRVNRAALWPVLSIYDMGDKLLNGSQSMYLYSLACVRVIGGESVCFRMDKV